MKPNLGDMFLAIARELAYQAVRDALHAYDTHGPMRSWHEAESVIREEAEEFTAEVREKLLHRERVRRELQDIVACCLRTLVQMRIEERLPVELQKQREWSATARNEGSRRECARLRDAWLEHTQNTGKGWLK